MSENETKKILILGAGAMGSNIAANLSADLKNESEITVLDFDTVEERNVQAGTQFYMPEQVGMSKVEALQYNIYKWFGKEIKTINQKLTRIWDLGPIIGGPYVGSNGERVLSTGNTESPNLVIDCFDNYSARKLIQDYLSDWNIALLHCGFSPQMTFEIKWAENYKVPENSPEGSRDICEMPGAKAFITRVASLGATSAREFIVDGNKIGFLGNKYTTYKLD